MRAVFVPLEVLPAGMAKLVATAPATDGGGMLTLFPVAGQAPFSTMLTASQLRGLLRQWAAADQSGLGLLEVSD